MHRLKKLVALAKRARDIQRSSGLGALATKGRTFLGRKVSNQADIVRNQGFAGYFNRIWHSRFFLHDSNPRGDNWFDQDWDNLIILDACRYDKLQQTSALDGSLESRTSLGSTSGETIAANLADRSLQDTVIVSANGFYQIMHGHAYLNCEVHDVRIVSDADAPNANELHEEWQRSNPGREWFLPEHTTALAKRTNEAYPDKRLLVHYHPPHAPYLGETGIEYIDTIPHKYPPYGTRRIDVSDDVLHKAYEENLEIVLEEVRELLPHLEGKTVISADHGEMLGDADYPLPITLYGHPQKTYTEELVKVPWLVLDHEERKSITAEDSENEIEWELDTDEIEERLENLGYKV